MLAIKKIISKRNTFSGRIFSISILFLMLALLLANVVCCLIFSTVIHQAARNADHAYMSNHASNMTNMLQKTILYANQFLTDEGVNGFVADYINYKKTGSYMITGTEQNTKQELYNLMKLNPSISGIQLVMKHDEISVGQIDFEFSTADNKYGYLKYFAKDAAQSVIWHFGQKTVDANPFNLSQADSLQIIGISSGSEDPWYVVISINPSYLLSDDTISIIDTKGNIIWKDRHNILPSLRAQILANSQLSSSGAFDSQSEDMTLHSHYFKASVDDTSDWIYVKTNERNEANETTREAVIFSILFSLLLIAAASVVCYLISRWFSKPIYELSKNLKNIHEFDNKQQGEITQRFSGFWISRWGFKSKLILFFLLVTLIPVFVYVITFNTFVHYQSRDFYERTIAESLKTTKTDIDLEINDIMQISKYLATDKDIQSILSHDSSSNSDRISQIIISQGFLNGNIKSIVLINDDFEKVYSSNQYNKSATKTEREMINRINANNEYERWMYSAYDTIEGYSIPYIRRVWKYDAKSASSVNSGYIIIKMDENKIQQELQNNQNIFPSLNFVINPENDIVFHQENNAGVDYSYDSDFGEAVPEISDVNIFRDGDNLLFSTDFKRTPWLLISIVKAQDIYAAEQGMIFPSLIMLLILSLFAAYLSDSFAVSLLRPIYNIRKGIEEIEIGNLGSIQVPQFMHSEDDLQALSNDFHAIISNTDKLLHEIYSSKLKEKELETRKKEAELISLQCQINPHFLYNTFTSIKFLVDLGETEKAKEMITSLGKLFRQSVFRGKLTVPVREEIEHAEAYVEIQKVRYPQNLEVHWEIDSRIYEYMTLKFILQPLVENAIKYGVESNNNLSIVIIRGYIDKGMLIFEIIDNGVGMSKEKLVEVKKQINGEVESNRVGVKNINERIKLYCGQEYGIKITSELGNMTCFRITLKLMKDEAGGANV